MNGTIKAAVALLVLSTAIYPIQAQIKTETALVAADMATARPAVEARPGGMRVIVVSLRDRRLALVEDGIVTKTFSVAVGKDSTPSPIGTFTIVQRVTNPTYYHDGKIIAPGPDNPVGTRWMGLSQHGYGIHGTNAPRSIGKAASHGCIRMARHDLEDLFAQVRGGDTVEIIGERNQETEAIFGEPVAPTGTTARAPAVVAQVAPNPVPATQVITLATSAATAASATELPAVVPVGQ